MRRRGLRLFPWLVATRVALLALLAPWPGPIPAGAQIGGSAMPDTTRQVSKVYKAAPGQRIVASKVIADTNQVTGVSLEAAASAYLQFPDTTITVNASGKKVLWYNLRDPRFVEQSERFNYDIFRVEELNTSWRAELGPMPSYGYITITAGGDSVVFWNALTVTRWAVFRQGASGNMAGQTGSALTDVGAFLDGVVFGAGGGLGTFRIDFLADGMWYNDANNLATYKGNIAQRNDNLGYLSLNTGAAYQIAHNTVTVVSAVRDPFGKRDGLGRLAQWWMAGTAGGLSAYNPYNNGIWDDVNTINTLWGQLTPSGSWLTLRNYTGGGARDIVYWRKSVFSIAADGWNADGGSWENTLSGSEDWAWGSVVALSRGAAIEGASWAGTAAPVFAVGSSAGLYLLHAKANANANGGKQLIQSGFNTGYVGGGAVVFPLESDYTDRGPTGIVGAAHGTGAGNSFAAGVIGKKLVGDGSVNSGASAYNTTALDYGTGDFSLSAWVTNTSAGTAWAVMAANAASTAEVSIISSGTSSWATRFIEPGGGGVDAITIATQTTNNGNLHHLVVVRSNSNTITTYIDGKPGGTGTLSNSADWNITQLDSICVLDACGGGGRLTGSIDQPTFHGKALTADEVQGMYRQGLAGIASTVSPCDCLPGHIGGTTDSVGVVKAHPSGQWLVGNQDTLMRLDRYGIPAWKMGTPGGLIKDADFADVGGGDSLGVVVVTASKVGSPAVVYQRIPDVRIADLAAYHWPFVQPTVGAVVVVDSAGVDGLFYTGDDGVDAAFNANRDRVFFKNGTYPPFDIDHNYMHVEGESWSVLINGGTTDDAIDLTGALCTVENLSVQTTSGGGQPHAGLRSATGGGNWIRRVYVVNSDNNGFNADVADDSFEECYVGDADNYAWSLTAGRIRVQNCVASNNLTSGIGTDGNGDNCQITDNHIQAVTNGIVLVANSDNNIVDGNITDAGVSDSGTGNTIGSNEQY